MKILYKRWDNCVFEIQFEKSKTALHTIKDVTRKRECSYEDAKDCFSYHDVEFLLHKDPYGNNLDYIKLKSKRTNEEYWFDRKAFLYLIELECDPNGKPSDAIMVANIKDYMNVIQYYRYIALVVRIKALLKRLEEADSPNLKNVAISTIEEIDKNSKLTKMAYTITTQFNKTVLDSAVSEIQKLLNGRIKDINKSLSPEESRIWKAIEHSIMLYEKGENFLYYRGVGHIVYPECPGSLRGNNKYFEDQYYRLAKTSHPNELANLTYLDRIAKIQHYGWPSRLLDVTSNPLVALYMACNTIYSNDDPQQRDLGEIIIYFRDELREKTYDSRTVLVAAALVKLTYQERKAMFEFINMHSKYFKYENKQIGIACKNLQTVLNLCVRIAVQRGCDAILTEEEKEQITKYVDNTKISFRKCAKPVDYIYRCIQGQTGRQKIKQHRKGEDQRMRFYSNGVYPENEEKLYHCVYSKELDFETYTRLFQYFVAAFDKLLVTIRREDVAFENKVDIFTMLKSYHVRLEASNDRILAQSGSFVVAGLDDAFINEKMSSSRRNPFVRIIVENKKTIFEELKLLNINDSTVFPDLQNTGDYVRKMFG